MQECDARIIRLYAPLPRRGGCRSQSVSNFSNVRPVNWRYAPRSTDLAIIVCNGPEKCVFVRVVDSCAGCAKGTSHVDLTKAAFSRLANLDMGVLQVEMRPATEPTDW